VTEVDSVGRNCVMYAVHHSQLDTLQILLEHGADANLQSHGLSVVPSGALSESPQCRPVIDWTTS